ncbi:MAG: hypothetical protein AVDCRST_MAG83-2089, partial [uncultured Arthrobacter sp.]
MAFNPFPGNSHFPENPIDGLPAPAEPR